jgi:hypothetical protein
MLHAQILPNSISINTYIHMYNGPHHHPLNAINNIILDAKYAHSDFPQHNQSVQKLFPRPPKIQWNIAEPRSNRERPATASFHPKPPLALIQGKRTNVYFHEDFVAGMIATYIHDFEDSI